jgi:hypothetical protein
MDDYKLEGYEKAKAKGKMYNALLKRKSDGKIIKVPFGDNKMENYQDKTGLNLYPELIHGDEKRRKNYRSRAKGRVKDGFYSASWFSFNILW